MSVMGSVCGHGAGHGYRDVATRMVMLISEVEELSQQLNDQFEEEVRSINAEALRELDELRQVCHGACGDVVRIR